MQTIKISAKELMVLASHLGETVFYGMKDPFYGMDTKEIYMEVQKINADLEAKGLISMGFDDSLSISSAAEETVGVCVRCDHYATVDWIDAGQVQPRELLYQRGASAVRIRSDADGLALEPAETTAFAKDLAEMLFTDVPVEQSHHGSVRVSETLFSEIKSLPESDWQTALISNGCSSDMAAALEKGLLQKSRYISIVLGDRINRKMDSLICVVDETGLLELQYAEEDDRNCWDISWTSVSALNETLLQKLQKEG